MSVNKLADKLIAKKYWGDEPIHRKVITSKIDAMLCKMLNWYNIMSDDKDKDKWLIEYINEHPHKRQRKS